jgi:hypothetical protein
LRSASGRSYSGGKPARSRNMRSTRSRGSERESMQVTLFAQRSANDSTTMPSTATGADSMSGTAS